MTSTHDPEILAAFAEGRLDADERRAMTAHLGACADCRRALAMLARAIPVAAPRRSVAIPVWLALAATVLLATFVVRRPDGPVAGAVEEGGADTAASAPAAPPAAIVESAPAGTVVPAEGPMLDPALLVKRGGAVRQAGGKTFRLRAGEWVDTSFESTASLPMVLIRGADERAAAVKRMPGLGPYAALGDRVVVVFDGSVYRFAP